MSRGYCPRTRCRCEGKGDEQDIAKRGALAASTPVFSCSLFLFLVCRLLVCRVFVARNSLRRRPLVVASVGCKSRRIFPTIRPSRSSVRSAYRPMHVGFLTSPQTIRTPFSARVRAVPNSRCVSSDSVEAFARPCGWRPVLPALVGGEPWGASPRSWISP